MTNSDSPKLTTWFHELSDEELLEAYKQDIIDHESKKQEEIPLPPLIKNQNYFEDSFTEIFAPNTKD